MARAPDPEAVRAAADRAEGRAAEGRAADGRAADGADRRLGRGRLSTLDQLPEDAQEDVVWAVTQLNARQRLQADILFELNDRLAAEGVDPISKSAFNRASMKLAAASSRVNEARRIFEGIAPQFTAERVDENTIVIGEFIKLLVFELAQSDGQEIGTKGAMELARAHLAVIQGQKISADRRRQLEEGFKAEAGKAIEKVAAAKGLSVDVQAEMRAALFGVAPAAAAARPEARSGGT